jgi:hypothetical protein
LKFKLKKWKNIEVNDVILISNLGCGISSHKALGIINSSKLHSTYLMLEQNSGQKIPVINYNEKKMLYLDN